MSAEEVVRIVTALERAGLSIWVDGGWAVDALVRTQTRAHDDLDLVVLLDEVPAVERELAALGYERAGGAPPCSFESVDAGGRQVDVHPIAADGAYRMREGGVWHYPLRGLHGRGVVAGRIVRCLTAEVQVITHAGYELVDKDLHDLRLLKPAQDVLEAFDARGEPEALAGGSGRAWRVGDLVLKPLDRAPEEIAWQADQLATVGDRGFRLERPRPEIVDGWTAWTFLDGRHEQRRWLDVIAVGERLHEALRELPPPPRTQNPWAIGDAVAWGERGYDGIDDVLAALRPLDDPSQVVHGDLCGNVLFHDTLPPAVIDLPAYYRPPQYASAIVVADAICWEGAPHELANAVAPQHLLRALVYRAVTSIEFGGDGARELEFARRIAAR